MRQTLRQRKTAAILLLAMAFAMSACGSPKNAAPDNAPCNNGFFAIMETENGYYMNHWGTQRLRYYDKASGNDIYLCPKPECRHDGSESCTATYRNMRIVNSVLYDGAIYILSIEEDGSTAGYYLYRAAPDGSALDRIGCAFSAENSSGEETFWSGDICFEGDMPAFMIHRGFAYIPFFMSFKHSMMGFVNGGIIKMDIKTGRTEQIYRMSDFHDSCPQKLRACGKYIFFDLRNARNKHEGTYCYDTESGDIFSPFGKEPDSAGSCLFSAVETEEQVFSMLVSIQDDGSSVHVLLPYNVCTGEQKQKPWEDIWNHRIVFDGVTGPYDVMLCEDRFFVSTDDRTIVYSMTAERLGEIPNPPDGDEPYPNTQGMANNRRLYFRISDSRLYAVGQPATTDTVAFEVFFCPIEDILAGNGTWTLAYSASGEWLPDIGSERFSWLTNTYYFKF